MEEEKLRELEAAQAETVRKLAAAQHSRGPASSGTSEQVHNAAVVARSLGCQCDTEIPTGRTLNAAASIVRVIN